MSITENHFRKVLGHFPTGVTVVTAPHGHGKDIGITISSFTSVSLTPPQILFCLSKLSKTFQIFKEAAYFAVNILSAHQHYISEGFAKHVPINWEELKTHRHKESGCLLLSDALAYIICEKGNIYDGGDHEIILGKVIDAVVISSELPLVRQRGHYLTTQPIQLEVVSELNHRKTSSF